MELEGILNTYMYDHAGFKNIQYISYNSVYLKTNSTYSD